MRQLLVLAFDLTDAIKGKKVKDKRLYYLEDVALKLCQHAASAYFLWQNHTKFQLDARPVDFVDGSSIQVLARACLESYLAFNYVFVTPLSEDEFEFRFNAWMLAGFAQRQSFPAFDEAAKEQQERDATSNEKRRQELQRSSIFQELPKGHQKRVLAGQDWHPGRTISEMCEDVFGPEWGKALYGYMSSHIHSDALAAVQVRQSKGKAHDMAEGATITICIVLARMCADYASKWRAVGKVYKTHRFHDLGEAYCRFKDFDPSQL